MENKFKNNFISIYGERVWKDFFNTTRQIPGSDVIKLKFYIEKIDRVSNFYKIKNKRFTRFVLITLEKYYGNATIDFSEILKSDSNAYKWEIEHIVSKAKKKDNRLSNLTIISRDLNGLEEYKIAEFSKKRELMKKNKEYYFYLNEIFRNPSENVDEYFESRGQQLKDDFKKVFCDENYTEYLLKILNISDNDVNR
ncbi:hypothetical protein GMA11_02130 [Granulicatella sp. zg-ZJ]|uniref:HNH endonuclease domain-containing protein n=1 Tax=unclassified Granulicatella TaxID=2630493 RepID=UPI0013BF0087|nr:MULTISPECIES: HNH endonuclease domain-containing protein [unclassified Granulicatella]NEW62185.1 hypothetical protein [Granulicatella sp. zg-ZJ]NEW66629.1 hypothetical protein [Granulicatella sp. zg-84]QMI85048.1 hypothetical protein H1220_04695 [Carnobacteriaceae bacterium zg-84]